MEQHSVHSAQYLNSNHDLTTTARPHLRDWVVTSSTQGPPQCSEPPGFCLLQLLPLPFILGSRQTCCGMVLLGVHGVAPVLRFSLCKALSQVVAIQQWEPLFCGLTDLFNAIDGVCMPPMLQSHCQVMRFGDAKHRCLKIMLHA